MIMIFYVNYVTWSLALKNFLLKTFDIEIVKRFLEVEFKFIEINLKLLLLENKNFKVPLSKKNSITTVIFPNRCLFKLNNG